MSNDHKEPGAICAWCAPGLPGNHGICERHAREMRRELARWAPLPGELRRYNGHRPDQVRFSLLALGVLAGALVCGLAVGAGAAVWEWVMRGGGM